MARSVRRFRKRGIKSAEIERELTKIIKVFPNVLRRGGNVRWTIIKTGRICIRITVS